MQLGEFCREEEETKKWNCEIEPNDATTNPANQIGPAESTLHSLLFG